MSTETERVDLEAVRARLEATGIKSLSVDVGPKWPFRVSVKDQDGNCVLADDLPCYSTADKTAEDAMNCVHHKPEVREEAAAVNARFLALMELIGHVPTDLAALCAEVERLREAEARLQRVVNTQGPSRIREIEIESQEDAHQKRSRIFELEQAAAEVVSRSDEINYEDGFWLPLREAVEKLREVVAPKALNGL